MRHWAQARNPYSRRWLWIPGSLAQRKIDARINFGARFAPRNDELIEICARRPGETMTIADKLVLQRQHHLKWRAFDRLELILMMLCGLLWFGFSLSLMSDIITRTIRHPWPWLQEVPSTLFIQSIFIRAAAASPRHHPLLLTSISET